MLQFEKLKLSGFKSFVDKTELDIAPGLNGIVGPNGCGKSNLVEALRWAMGESSAKRMRGDGMEDVIFNGTDQRTARNIAEVSLFLDNAESTAPAQYNDLEQIEVVRRIERDRGSNYKINGKNVRARDVQMLFADTVTGANSPALVSQGQISKIISAKPTERRIILEESAGISGLYARRHEAELRLKAADANLLRVNDILGDLETRLNSLKRQARMAAKYKNLSAQIRQLDLVICYMNYRAVVTKFNEHKNSLNEIEQTVSDKMVAVSQLSKTQETLHVDLPELRKQEIEIATKLQALNIEVKRIEDAEAQKTRETEDLKRNIEQSQTDLTHETETASESKTNLEKLAQEQENLIKAQESYTSKLAALEKDMDAKGDIAKEKETVMNTAMQTHADKRAKTESLQSSIDDQIKRLDDLKQREDKAQANLQELASTPSENKATAIAKDIQAHEAKVKGAQNALEKTQAQLSEIDGVIEIARQTLKDQETQTAKIDTEISVLQSFIDQQTEPNTTPVRDSIKPTEGFERAVSRALGDSLLASLDENSQYTWINRDLKALPNLPKGAQPLSAYVDAPKALSAALSQIGVVENKDEAQTLFSTLEVGQSIVTKDGTYMRWDGYCIKAEASDRNADILEHRNKLESLKKQQTKAEKKKDEAQTAHEKAARKKETLQNALSEQRHAYETLQNTLSDLKIKHVQAQETELRAQKDREYLEESLNDIRGEMQSLNTSLEDNKKALSALQNSDADSDNLDELKLACNEARQIYQNAMREFDQIKQSARAGEARLQAMGDERNAVKNRMIRAEQRQEALTNRIEELKAALKAKSTNPKETEAKKDELLDKIATLESTRATRSEKLAEREAEIAQTMKALRESEASLSEAREKRGASQASLQSLEEQRKDIYARSVDRFQIKPQDLESHISIQITDTDTVEGFRSRRTYLNETRDKIGAVNLRAEEEADELEQSAGQLIEERNDLEQAIAELREGIDTINAEARSRLMEAFETVNAHFQTLFVRLFGGGKAHLELVKTEENTRDPLVSGLEIFAQPPGKSLQSLSLLSGGEQTLASIALIFAMFLTNPSPICVLDEIDAPLDDANVERVCDMLDHIVKNGKTRFLIVTHHRLTMARMDRLYGVTMSEKGVSQLVSVDLQQSFGFLEAA
jgi:chromosome segregation protein